METRRLGKTGHRSTVCIFGTAALWEVSQAEADQAIALVRAYGVNHFDVAPSYGRAEELLGAWLEEHRPEVYLACKTMERTRQGAWEELQRSLERMHVKSLDLYQLHAVREMDELEQALAPGGAIEALLEARQRGLTRALGITGHGYHAPAVHAAALERFDFDTVMTPINFVQWADPAFRDAVERLLRLATEKDVGVLVIKALTRGPWANQAQAYRTWYRPFDEPEMIECCVRFVLSQPVTAFASPGDLQLLPHALEAAERFTPMSADEQNALLASAPAFEPLFPAP
ncbi:MAG: aldo/keto reductase [Chloroflexota bacterium]